MAGYNQGFKITVFVEAGEDMIWSRMRDLQASKGGFTVPEVLKGIRQRKDTIAEYVRRLEKAGFVARIGTTPTPAGDAVTYRLTSKRLVAPRVTRAGIEHPETKTQLMWRAMKMLHQFTARELQHAATVDDHGANLATVKSYLKHLKRAGIVTAPPRKRATDPERYRLSNNIGALPPRILSTKLVYDPNAHAIVGAEATAEGVPE